MARQGPSTARRWAAWLAQWAALAALYYVAIHLALRGAGPPAGRIVAGDRIVGFAALLGSASLRLAAGAFAAASRAAEDRRALLRSLAGAPPQDGKRYAAAGRIAPLGAPLAAPLSGVPCVAYRYAIGPGEAGSPPAFAGLGLAPSAIATGGPAGEIRLLGFPRLDGFPEAALAGGEARARAADYVGGTSFASFEDAGAGGLAPATGAPDEVGGTSLADYLGGTSLPSGPLPLAAGAGTPLRRDWRAAGRRELGGEDRLAETVVPPGAEVCAWGLFHAAEGGIAPDPSPEGRPLRLALGGAAQLAAALAREGRGRTLIALALLAVPHALLAALLLAR